MIRLQQLELEAMHPKGCLGVARYADLLPLLPCRAGARLPAFPQSVILFLFPYYVGQYPERNISRYAILSDYHTVAGELLAGFAQSLCGNYPQHHFVPFVDNSPIREVEAGRMAGLGVVGLNGQLIHPVYGSYVFIGSIVTDLALDPATPNTGQCLRCGRCIESCPTGALTMDRPFERERCRSHITQKKGALTPWEREQVREGGMVWGCDLCTDACPMNREAAISPIAAFWQEIAPIFHPDSLERLMDSRAYNYRGRAVLLRNWELITTGSGGSQQY